MAITDNMKIIKRSVEEYSMTVERALSNYRRDKAHIRETYKENIAAEKLTKARQEAHSSILAADGMLRAQVMLELKDARNALSEAIMPDEKNGGIRTIRLYREFGVTPTETEIRTIAGQMRGNVFALRALAEWAKMHNYSVSAPSVDHYAGELERMERHFAAEPYLFAPGEYMPEALEVLPNKVMRRNDGTVYADGGRPDATDIVTHTQYFESIADCADRAASDWGFTFIPEIKKIDPDEYSTKQEAEEAQRAENDRFDAAVAAQVDAMSIKQPAPAPAPEMSRAEQASIIANYK